MQHLITEGSKDSVFAALFLPRVQKIQQRKNITTHLKQVITCHNIPIIHHVKNARIFYLEHSELQIFEEIWMVSNFRTFELFEHSNFFTSPVFQVPLLAQLRLELRPSQSLEIRPAPSPVKQDRFTTCFKTCGTGSLFCRVGGCKVPLVPRLSK